MNSKILLKTLALAAVVAGCCVPATAWAAVANLNDFELELQINSLQNPPGGATDYSGITYNYDTDSLFIISNGNSHIFEYTTTGTFVRRISTTGFTDSEDISYLGDGKYAIIEEGVKDINILTIGKATTSLTKAGSTTITPKIGGTFGNNGFEGVTFNSTANVFYAVKERVAAQVYEIQMDGTSTLLTAVTNTLTSTMTDFSSVYYDNAGGDLFVLSHESNKIARVKLDGTLVGTRAQPGTQVEGISFSPDGLNMYVVGEVRQYFHYAAPEPSSFLLAAAGGLICLVVRQRRRR